MSEETLSPRVQYMVDDLRRLEGERQEFAKRHGFAFKRPRYFKECVVLRWKHRRRKDPGFIDHERINQYVEVLHAVVYQFGLRDEKHPLLDSDLMLIKGGIFSCYQSRYKLWAIPNSNREVKEFVLSHLPKWCEVREQ